MAAASAAAASTSTSTAAANWESEEWELTNDDGFVYKRKKRRPDLASLAPPPPDPAPDPELEERQRRERKRKALLKVRDKYAREIFLWEHLSNTLRASERSTKEKQEQRARLKIVRQKQKHLQREGAERASARVPKGIAFRSLADGLLLKVQAQEALISRLTNLCDVAEALCNAEEDKVKQLFLDLPIWGSPRELMESMCKD
ncbi:hypothetical protein Dimus_030933 [Dionaea muscipula]